MSLLKAQGLSKIYSSKGNVVCTALNDLDLQIEYGEFVGVMGLSGSGKTTLLNLLAAMDRPTSGNIEINGINPNKLSDKELALFRRRELGFIFQDFNLLDSLTIKENIILTASGTIYMLGLAVQLDNIKTQYEDAQGVVSLTMFIGVFISLLFFVASGTV
ncbi:TPA: ABC transporter ATP-binding protein [Bacillus thuringiensis]|nr:ABC transporter ATP-binding protein [Bacillus thuringiensis]